MLQWNKKVFVKVTLRSTSSFYDTDLHGYAYVLAGEYRKTCNISHTLVGNKIVDHSDVVGASPVGAAPTTSSFST